jgi:hypothetical protein
VVVKTTEEDKLIADLTETFANLREFQWKLNPTKCVFGVALDYSWDLERNQGFGFLNQPKLSF